MDLCFQVKLSSGYTGYMHVCICICICICMVNLQYHNVYDIYLGSVGKFHGILEMSLIFFSIRHETNLSQSLLHYFFREPLS